ncbi:MAG: gliding motility-associated C-terminal domain-containing protein [Bacteroidetes bacterium]|nr:gliding motility-associated C-terminal domain-containing protein [Bacteroidota bacterium]
MNRFLQTFFLLFICIGAFAQVPTATIVSPSATLCSGTSLTFTTQTTNAPTAYSWSVSPSRSVNVLPDYSSPSITFTFTSGGSYVISLLVSNATGTSITTSTVFVTKSATAAFNASLTTTGFPNQLILTNYSTNSISNQWLFNDDPSVNTTSLNAVKNYSISGSYSVTLISYGNSGCNDTDSYAVRIADSSGITLPTVFSPNGDDINEIFKPIAKGISSMNVWIYNRYGTIIIKWDRVNSFWDGHTTSGERCEAGVYFVIVEATGFDGKAYKLKHSLTLVR